VRIKRFATAVGLTAVGALVVSGCAPGGDSGDSGLVEGSSITAAWNQAFYSMNGNTSFGNATANNNINYLVLDGFNYYNNTPELVQNTSFGTYELVSEDPLTVTYTVAEGVNWSDGTPVDAADLMLNWAALSRALDTPDFDPNDFVDPDTGEFTDAFPTDVVYFDSGATPDSGMGLVTETPEIGDDGRSITMTFNEPFVDWDLVFTSPLPAHIIAEKSLDIEDADEAKQAVLDAIESEDAAALAPMASFWNSGFNFTEMPEDTDLVTASGPYMISDYVADQYVTLTANPEYAGDNSPNIEEITIRFIPDPLAAVQALENGDVDIIQPQATADITTALEGIDGITVTTGLGGTYEHVDLQFDNGKNPENIFSNPQVREAFMMTIPRQEIVDTLIKPIIGDDAILRDSQLFVPGAEGYDESAENNTSAEYAEVDIEGARQLLEESGVTDTSVCILYASNNPRRVNEFALIQASANEAGFDVTDCGSEEWGGLLGTPGAYDASLFGWQSTSLGVTNSLPTFVTNGINNLNFYSNEEVDSIISQLNVTFDPQEQIDLQVEMDRLLWEDYYGVTIYQFPEVTAFSDRVENIDPSILAPTIFWNAWDWAVTDSATEE
tara:strand:+ start:938 stop:2770 length:1833 start_codon:yes stop_codon:yes gene_type:complete